MKKLIGLVLALVLLFSLTSCGSAGSSTAASASAATVSDATASDTTASAAETPTAEVLSAAPAAEAAPAVTPEPTAEPASESVSEPAEGSDSLRNPAGGITVDISGNTYTFPVSKSDFENDEISFGTDYFNDGGMYQLRYKGNEMANLLLVCDGDLVAGIRIGMNTVSSLGSEAPVFTVNGLTLGQEFTEELRTSLEGMGFTYDVCTGYTLDDGTEYDSYMLYQGSNPTASGYLMVFFMNSSIVGFQCIWD